MASPQTENGYTKIANEIMEALARYRLSGRERQILDVILRKTYGFNKKFDYISMSQFAQSTGMRRPDVAEQIKKLLGKNLIGVTQNPNTNNINMYIFQKDWQLWKVLPKKLTVTQNPNTLLGKTLTKVLGKTLHTKEKKETITKEIHICKDVKPFFEYASKTFKETFKETMLIEYGKDGKAIKGLLQIYDLPKLQGLWDAFLASDDNFIRKAGYSIGVFKTQINKLLTAKKGGNNGTDRKDDEYSTIGRTIES